MKTLSIEYAHIYSNQAIGEEHQLAVVALQKVIDEYQAKGYEIIRTAMVDDYSSPDPTFDYVAFRDWLRSHQATPDLLYRESQLMSECDRVLALLDNEKLKRNYIEYIQSRRYPCSLFIAAWYLLRLGKLDSLLFPAELQATELMNILPESFKPFEEKGLELIGATRYKDCLERIHYTYLPIESTAAAR